ncbi:MAG: RNA-binding protein [Nitrososphaeraceae archaeon]
MQSSLDEINYDLKNVEERREKLIKGTRDVISLCSKSIVALHHDEMEKAEMNMHQAKIMLDEFRQYSKTDLYKYVSVAEQEIVEAYGLKSVIQNSAIPSMKELNVSGPSYITGLLDCIGEIKRMVYDRMRIGRGEDAAKLFSLMQDIYRSIYPFAVYDHLISGMRRKLDVAKMLIEDVRAVVTEETRRNMLIKAIDSLERKLESDY